MKPIKVLSFHTTFYEALHCMMSDAQLSLWPDCMSAWTILCLTMTSTCHHTDVTGNSKVSVSALTWVQQITKFDNYKFQMPRPAFSSSHITQCFQKVFLSLKSLPSGAYIPPYVWDCLLGLPPGSLEKCVQNSPLQSGKEGSNLLTIGPLRWMRWGTGPIAPTLPCFSMRRPSG